MAWLGGSLPQMDGYIWTTLSKQEDKLSEEYMCFMMQLGFAARKGSNSVWGTHRGAQVL